MGATGFELSKWYADCVADDGEVIIAYVARLAWRGFHLSYASLLHASANGAVSSQSTVMNVAVPVVSSSEFCWRSAAFGFEGRWTPRQDPIQQTIYESADGSIRWDCQQPAAEGTVTLQGRELRGAGYVERLDMTLPPWKVPIDVLQWGRFVGNGHSVVWIEWQGKHPVRHVWTDGKACEADVIDKNSVVLLPASVLHLSHPAVLREGAIGKTVLDVLPRFLGPLPGRVLGIHETKWRSRGVLTLNTAEVVRGWAIHEVVEWPK